METVITTRYAYMTGQAGRCFELDDTIVELPYPGLLIADCGLHSMSNQGKGYGKELYRKALAEHGVLYSIWPVSEDAMRVHDSLIKSGIARFEAPDNDFGIIALVSMATDLSSLGI